MNNKNCIKQSGVLITLLFLIYGMNNFAWFNIDGLVQWNYWNVSLVWIGVIFYIYIKGERVHPLGKRKYYSAISAVAFNSGVAYILCNIIAGLLQGFGKSPYDHSITGIIVNTIIWGSALAGTEFIRSQLVNTFGRAQNYKNIIGLVLIMTVFQLSLSKILGINSVQSLTIYLGQVVFPQLCDNLFATYLVLYGGPWASITYFGMIQLYEWVSPILPNIDWLARGIIGMGVPLVGWMYLTQSYNVLTRRVKKYREPQENIWSMVGTGAFCVGLIWFTVGVFPIYPSAIATGSMEPGIKPGDVVLVDKVTSEEELRTLQVGDVIQFQRDDILISHRIIEIVEKDGIPCYRTKGDNNSTEDYRLVEANEVKGKIVGCIPKIGWPTLVFRSHDPQVLEEVEF